MQLSISPSIIKSNNSYRNSSMKNQSFRAGSVPAPIIGKSAQAWRMGNSKGQVFWGVTATLIAISATLASLSEMVKHFNFFNG